MSTHNYFINAKFGQFAKYSKRLNRLLENGTFYALTKQKQSMLLRRLKRLYQQLSGTAHEAKLKYLLAPAVAVMLSFGAEKVSAQAFAPSQLNSFGLQAVASYAFPAFADIDGDGDLDAFIGELGGNIIYFENTGSSALPSFGTPQTNAFGITAAGSVPLPSLVDIDGDGDIDLFVGDNYGAVFFFENTGTASSPAFGPIQTNPFGITQGVFSAPAVADLDGDGDFDLMVGEYYGNFMYFENTGTASAPSFAAPQTNSFGLTATGGNIAFPAFGDLDGDGDMDILAGGNGDNLMFYDNIGTPAVPSFAAPQTNPFGLGQGFVFAFPAFADIDGDGDLDVFAGEYYGNTKFYENVSIPNDLGVTELISPVSSCNLSSSESITMKVKNFGTASQNSISISYSLNGNTPVTENVTSVLNPGGTYTHTFASLVDMSTAGPYNFSAWTTLAGDSNTFNDTLNIEVNHKPTVNFFPHLQDFEAGNGGWTAGGANSTWGLGTPSALTINSAASGTKAWATNLSGIHNNSENSFVESPCFDFTNLANAVVELKLFYELESTYDGAALYSSIDGGITWQIIGAMGDTANWYNSSNIWGLQSYTGNGDGWDSFNGGWLTSKHDISSLDGENDVLFRMNFGSDGSVTYEGIAFDDFKITGDFTDPGIGIKTYTDNNGEPRMFPNPASRNVSIEIELAQEETVVELWNPTGQMVKSDVIPAGSNSILVDLKNLSAGVYQVKIRIQDRAYTKKLVVLK